MTYYKRIIDKKLLEWKASQRRKPLLIRGARQVGKSSAVRHFGKEFKYFVEINLESQKKDPDSVYQYYRRLLALRKDPAYAETVVYGELVPVFEDQDRVMAYYRKSADQTLLVIGNYKTQPQTLTLPAGIRKIVLNNLPQLKTAGNEIVLEGYQAVILEV